MPDPQEFDKKFGSLTQSPTLFLYPPPGLYIDRCIITIINIIIIIINL